MTGGSPAHSLAGRIAAAFRELAARPSVTAGRRAWIMASAVALLIALAPLLTIAGAALLAGGARSADERLAADEAPRIAAARRAEADRAALSAIVRRPGIGATLDALARALPGDAMLLRAGRDAEGRLAIEVSAPDPDQLRAALRREPALAGLRDAGQRQGDAGMVVSFTEPAP